MQVVPTKTNRLEARVSAEVKELLEQAAHLQGRSLTDFVVNAAQEAANETIRRSQMLELTAKDQQTFFEALLNPPAPSSRLRQAARRYKTRLVAHK